MRTEKVVVATHFAPALDLFNQKLDGTDLKSKASWYIVASHDRTVHPELERFAAKRMGATIYETDSGHVRNSLHVAIHHYDWRRRP
jgi:hypothetical protein